MSNLPQESVWDYPRPPHLEPTSACIRIVRAGLTIAETTHALRILETSHPPVYYLPVADIAANLLQPSPARGSFCEFKGVAAYWSLQIPQPGAPPILVPDAAWSYPSPTPRYAALAGHLAFYASRLATIQAQCWVEDEIVLPQPGDFYGGWITSNLRGPFKGAPGTRGW
jgi:uncharacterized protein (DUF427 family)